MRRIISFRERFLAVVPRQAHKKCYNITDSFPGFLSMPRFALFLRRTKAYRGSSVLASSAGRALRVMVAVLFLWGLTAWAMGWW